MIQFKTKARIFIYLFFYFCFELRPLGRNVWQFLTCSLLQFSDTSAKHYPEQITERIFVVQRLCSRGISANADFKNTLEKIYIYTISNRNILNPRVKFKKENLYHILKICQIKRGNRADTGEVISSSQTNAGKNNTVNNYYYFLKCNKLFFKCIKVPLRSSSGWTLSWI